MPPVCPVQSGRVRGEGSLNELRARARVPAGELEGYLDGKLMLTHELPARVSGKAGVWSKSDSIMYFADFTVKLAP